ncbi:unnamed protein product, partial [Eruca vesicaria subsp. sativa]|nr:unnamed protein product [Eruca vesicaria subsp. sativa]
VSYVVSFHFCCCYIETYVSEERTCYTMKHVVELMPFEGVNRAFPYVSTNEAQTPVIFKLVHSKNFNVGVHSLILLDKISSKNKIVSDKFYRALYSKLLLSSAMNSSKESSILLSSVFLLSITLKCLLGFSPEI